MATREISEKEFAVIREISNNNLPNQRTIATKTGFSLGLTNLIIKKLIKTGYIKIRQLNRRKIQYILTPKGFSEKAKKSYNYTLKTINMLKTVKEKIQGLITEYNSRGVKEFIIVGKNEISDITEISFRTLVNVNDLKYRHVDTLAEIGPIPNGDSCVIFLSDITKLNPVLKRKFKNAVQLIDYLSDSGILL